MEGARYGELIRFEPLDTVVRLVDRVDTARRVETFVFSERMEELLVDLVVPRLDLDRSPPERPALLVTGAYGTGKSHLLSVVSAVAEDATLCPRVRSPPVRSALAPVAGRFFVVRAELDGAVALPEFVLSSLRDALAPLGVEMLGGPGDSGSPSFKHILNHAMQQLTAKHPGRGVLFVLDELLDHLRATDDRQLAASFSFLRAVAEVTGSTPLRFVAGVQESLFDEPRLRERARAVEGRFLAIAIDTADVEYVVSQRLTAKAHEAREKVGAHLGRFAPRFERLQESLDRFVRLFPIHPSFIETLSALRLLERREVLRTVAELIERHHDHAVPEDRPGVFSYDAYFEVLERTPHLRAVPEVREVLEATIALRTKLTRSSMPPTYRAAADRIARALALDHLAGGGGLTPADLADQLLLDLPVPENDAEFLRASVETVLGAIRRATSGQLVRHDPSTGRYHLDLSANLDFDAILERRAAELSEATVDATYLELMRRLLAPDSKASPGKTAVCPFELDWLERRAGRLGHLVLGAYEDRPSGLPERAFVLCFPPPGAKRRPAAHRRPGVLSVRLVDRSPELDDQLRAAAAAESLARSAAQGLRAPYLDRARAHWAQAKRWVREHVPARFEVVGPRGVQCLADAIDGSPAPGDLRAHVVAAGSSLLADHFAAEAPEHPYFPKWVRAADLPGAARDAVSALTTGTGSPRGHALLRGLGLEGEDRRPNADRSPYLAEILGRIDAKPAGQVLNRSELLRVEAGLERWGRLEPALLAVCLAAGVMAGALEVESGDRRIDAATLEALGPDGLPLLAGFNRVCRPRAFPLGAGRALAGLLGLEPDGLDDPASRPAALAAMQGRVAALADRVAAAETGARTQTAFGVPVVEPGALDDLARLRRFLEASTRFSTEDRFRRLPWDAGAIRAHRRGLDRLEAVESTLERWREVASLVAYLWRAEAALPPEHPWNTGLSQARHELACAPSSSLDRRRLLDLARDYRRLYVAAHQAEVAGGRLDCSGPDRSELERDPICRRCGFRPAACAPSGP